MSLAASPAAAAPAAPLPVGQPPAATTVASLAPVAAPPEPDAEAGPKTPLPPRRPVEFRHFVVRKPAPPVPQTAAAAPEPAAAVSQ
ncbi:hypothetical protein EU555_09700 [Methylobacterium nonmethylotrophicum]|uniref:Uncharacterized protein n=1 Tax=Methylobacterium nonmethylotrophicum TaxID=1141884 RepID=A0A4Z0NUX8_9HYPH|nr:hypothetical protein EU555_09700 [Methylobacterium nonmethylotrophicum]